MLALSMAALMALAAFAGCKAKEGTTSSTPPSSTPVSSETPKKAASGQLDKIYEDTVAKVFGDQPPAFTKLEDKAQLKEMTGADVDNDAVKAFIYAMPMINVQFQILFGIEANDGKVADVEKLLNDYKAKVIADKEEFAYVDFGLEKAKGAQVVTIDNYVFYVCLANTFDLAEGEELTQADIDAKIQEAVDVVKAAVSME